MRFKDLLDGDFPPEYRKMYMERARKTLKNADKSVKIEIIEKKFQWDGVTHVISFKWNVPNNFFSYYDLLTKDEQEEIADLAKKALKKVEEKFKELKNKLTPDIKFDIHVDYSLILAAQHARFKYAFVDWLKTAVQKRYHYLNDREYLRKIKTPQDARQFSDDVRQILELLKYLKTLET